MPLTCGLGLIRTSTLQKLHVAVTTQLWHLFKVNGSSPGQRPMHFPSQTPAIHSCHPPFLAYLTSKPLLFKYSFIVSIHLSRGLPTEQLPAHSFTLDPISNPVILYSLHMAERSENTFIIPHNCLIRAVGTFHSPGTQQTYEVVHLYSPNPKSLLLLP